VIFIHVRARPAGRPLAPPLRVRPPERAGHRTSGHTHTSWELRLADAAAARSRQSSSLPVPEHMSCTWRARSYLLRHGAFVFAGDEHARTTRSIIQPVWHGMVVCTRGARATPPGDLIPRLPPRAGWPSRHSRHANRKDKTRWVPRFDGRAAPRAGEFQTVAPAAVAAALARLQIGVPLP
jgi:hypothetical protein